MTLSTTRSGLSRYKPGDSRQGAGLALLIEAVLLVIGILIFNNTGTIKKALSEPVPIMLVTEKPQVAPPEKKIPLPQFKNKLALPEPEVKTASPEPVVPIPVPVVQSKNAITETPPPPPPPHGNASADPSIEYAAKVRAAVQAAVYYPPAAVALRFSGRVRVEFHLRDGVPSQARVLTASGIGMIDRAALESVRNARYPEPPQELRGNDGLYQVWVEFTH